METRQILQIGILFIIALIYFYVKKRDNKMKFIIHKDFGVSVNNAEKRKIIKDKILHKNVSFIAYLVSLSLCFLTSLSGIYLIFIGSLSTKLFADVISIIGSGLMTYLFKNLHNKCSAVVDKLQ